MKVWRLLKLDYTVDQIVDSLSREFKDVAREQIHNDVLEFVADVGNKGLLRASDSLKPNCLAEKLLSIAHQRHRPVVQDCVSQAQSTAVRCLTLKALLIFLAFDLCRLGNNFPGIHRVVTNWPVSFKLAPPNAVERICHAVNYACVFYPKRVLCLQRSFVTTCLARSCGVEAQMVMGAQTVPFKAHAWTEVGGKPVNERRDVQRIYSVWERC